MPILKKILCAVLLIFNSTAAAEVTVRLLRDPVACYEIATLSCQTTETPEKPFISIHLTARITSPDGIPHAVEGFYNGAGTWLLRFMPNKIGRWSYTWKFGEQTGSGSFTCIARQNAKLHGHIFIDPSNPHKIRHEDGTALHWIGGKYIDFDDPYYLDNSHSSVPERLPKANYLTLVRTYLQAIAGKGLNGIVLKMRVLPINDDLETMDLSFLSSADQVVEWCMDLGINVELNFLDTWGKRKPGADIGITNPPVNDLLLEPHNPATFAEATEFYFRYLIARYAAYSNIVWELWNEAERMKTPAGEATALYAQYFKKYDPYQLPISASEIHAGGYPVQISSFHAGWKCAPSNWNFTHATTLYPPTYYAKYANFASYGYSNNRPILWNEAYPNDGQTEYYTLQTTFDWFRATFWGNLTAGSIGTSEFCWADIRQVPNLVTDYHAYLAAFVQQLIDVNALEPADAEVEINAGTATMCRNPGKEYIIYHFTQVKGSQSRFQVKLPAGNYYFQFFNPKTGQFLSSRTWLAHPYSGWQAVDTPGFNYDIVLYVVEDAFSQTVVPVELAFFTSHRSGDRVILQWRTESESSNYGFEIERSADAMRTFERVGFVSGQGTTSTPHDYTYSDRPPLAEMLSYRLIQIDADGTRHLYPPEQVKGEGAKPESFSVHTYPNPGCGELQFQFHLDNQQQVRYTIYNIRQQMVYESDWVSRAEGEGRLTWDGRGRHGERVAAGVYFLQLEGRGGPQGPMTAVGRFIYMP
jgi:hypothetical protein